MKYPTLSVACAALLAGGALASCVPDVERTGSLAPISDRGKVDDPALRAGLERLASREREREAAGRERAGAPAPVPPVQVAKAPDPLPDVQPPAVQAAAPQPQIQADADTPLDCLPAGLRRILDETALRFGSVEVVSTTHLHTGNHNAGRAKIHADCKAADIRTPAPPAEVVAFVRTLPGLGGIGSYRNGVIHLDDASAHPPDSYANRPTSGDEAGRE